MRSTFKMNDSHGECAQNPLWIIDSLCLQFRCSFLAVAFFPTSLLYSSFLMALFLSVPVIKKDCANCRYGQVWVSSDVLMAIVCLVKNHHKAYLKLCDYIIKINELGQSVKCCHIENFFSFLCCSDWRCAMRQWYTAHLKEARKPDRSKTAGPGGERWTPTLPAYQLVLKRISHLQRPCANTSSSPTDISHRLLLKLRPFNLIL